MKRFTILAVLLAAMLSNAMAGVPILPNMSVPTEVELAQSKSRKSCCLTQKNICSSWCRNNRPNDGCYADCTARVSACYQTGTYHWKNRASYNCR